MAWMVLFHEEFDADYAEFGEAVQDELLAVLKLLREHGPKLGRPHVDTLKGSDHANMKELRFSVDGGVWRVAFAFDTERESNPSRWRRQVRNQSGQVLQALDSQS